MVGMEEVENEPIPRPLIPGVHAHHDTVHFNSSVCMIVISSMQNISL